MGSSKRSIARDHRTSIRHPPRVLINVVHGILQCVAVCITVVMGSASASTNSSEITDTWWNPGESGWGVNVIQQRDVAFRTFFVYDRPGNPVWCTRNGIEEAGGTLLVNQNGSAITVTSAATLGTCTYKRTYSQTGKLREVTGSHACNNGVQGSFDVVVEMTPTISGFTGRITGLNQFCQSSGSFGGLRRAP